MFLEVVTVLLARRGLDVAVRVAEILLQAREVEFAMETFRAQRQGDLSFADAAIVTVARQASSSEMFGKGARDGRAMVEAVLAELSPQFSRL